MCFKGNGGKTRCKLRVIPQNIKGVTAHRLGHTGVSCHWPSTLASANKKLYLHVYVACVHFHLLYTL